MARPDEDDEFGVVQPGDDEFEPFIGDPEMPIETEEVAEPVEMPAVAAKAARLKTSAPKSGKMKKVIGTVVGLGVVVVAVAVLLPTIESHFASPTVPMTAYKPKVAPGAMATNQMMTTPVQNLSMPGSNSSNPNAPSGYIPSSTAPTIPAPPADPVSIQVTGVQHDMDTAFAAVTTELNGMSAEEGRQAQQIGLLQQEVQNLDADVQKLNTPPAPQAVAAATTTMMSGEHLKPSKHPADTAMVADTDKSKKTPSRVLTHWHLMGISQTAAAFQSPDGYSVTADMGGEVRGLHAKLINLVPYNGSWEALTTKGIIRP